jgi:hypothetical protein
MPTSKEEVSFTFNTSELLEDIDDNVKEDANFAAGEIALDAVKEYMSKQNSPVKGQRKFSALQDKKYKQYKQRLVGNKKANLELTGGLKDGMFVDSDQDGFTISVDPENTEQAYNHQIGDTVLPRQFLPFDDGTFKKPIVDKIKKELGKYKRGRKKAREVEQEFLGQGDSPSFQTLVKEFEKQNEQKRKKVLQLNTITSIADLFND